MRRIRPALLAVTALVAVSCSAPTTTEVRVEIAQGATHEGRSPGDPLSGGVLHLLNGDDVVYEATLDDDGAAVIEPTPGVYTVQVRLDSSEDALCFWGETTFGVAFPSSHIDLEAAFICAGG